jgi:acetyltransferase
LSVRNLDALFAPRAIAVVGASERPHSVGNVVVQNLLRAGFEGPVMPVNPKHRAVAGVLAYPNVGGLPAAPDLGVVCTPPAAVPGVIAELGRAGARAAIVLTAGLGNARGPGAEATLARRALEAARPHTLRILGPNCLGLLVPGRKLDASFAHLDALPGGLAFVSQSGAFCTAVLDWARPRGIGFSHFVSLGDSADVDAGDVLDWLGGDADVRAILLYLEAVTDARKFLSAARAAARNKPVIALKAGRAEAGARAAASHTGALAGADDVYDAAFARTGVLRVFQIEELFEAAETLDRAGPLRGERLAIVTNGGGPGVAAADALALAGGRLAELDAETTARLDAVLPRTWSRANPIDMIGDAPAERYAAALEIVLAAPGVDAVLVMHAPTALASGEEAARAVVSVAARAGRPAMLACWLGQATAERGRALLRGAGIATHDTPEAAVRAFLHRVRHRRSQEMLLETPPSLPEDFAPRTSEARAVIARALEQGRSELSEPEAKQVLAAYGIPVVETRIAPDAERAVAAARAIGFPVVLKVLSPEVSHKTGVGGVALDLESDEAVRGAARAMAERLAALRPGARLVGYSVQPMVPRAGHHELIAGCVNDTVFGPVILFGEGGTDVELIRDRALALPPLNLKLARDLVAQTRVARRLAGSRGRAPADLPALHLALVRLAQLVSDLPEVQELDANPLLAGADGVLALDARMRVERSERRGPDRLAIRPYPRELEETLTLAGGRRVLLRPIRPEDEPAHLAFFEKLAPDDVRFRFFGSVRRMPHSQLARYTQIDYDREMAFIATAADGPGGAETLGVVRAIADPDNARAEFAIIVRSDLKGQGLGHALLEKTIRYCRARGTRELVGQVLPDNLPMLDLAASLGFSRHWLPLDRAIEVRLPLGTPPPGPGDPAAGRGAA